MIPEQSYNLCLNPNCQNPPSRLFLSNKQHDYLAHQKCNQWIINMDTIYNYPQIDCFNGFIRLNIKDDPINSLLFLNSVQKWDLNLNNMFDFIIKDLTQKIQVLRSQKLKELAYLKNLVNQSIPQILYCENMIKTNKKIDIQSVLPNFYKFCQIKKLSLLNTDRIKEIYENKIQVDLIEMFNHTQKIIDFEAKDEARQIQVKKKVDELFESEGTTINERLQQLARAYKIEINKAKYDESISRYKIQCWICKQFIQSDSPENEKLGVTPRQSAAQNLLKHMRNDHTKEIYSVYMQKVLKLNVYQLQLKDVVQQIKQYCDHLNTPLQNIWIIDRQNSGTLDCLEEFMNRSDSHDKAEDYWIDVVNKENKHLAKTRFLAAYSTKKDAADILIGLLAYQLIKQTKAKIYLVTKDHFGIALQEIISNNFSKRFVTMTIAEAVSCFKKRKPMIIN